MGIFELKINHRRDAEVADNNPFRNLGALCVSAVIVF